MSKRVGLSLLALLIVLGGSAFGQTVIFPGYPTPGGTDPNATNWSFENGDLSDWLVGNAYHQPWGGFSGSTSDPDPPFAYARIFVPGGIAAYLTTNALAGAIYGATAAIARNNDSGVWSFELFMGGAPSLASGTPSGSTLLASMGSSSNPTSTGNAGFPNWGTFGVESTAGAVGGESIWMRILASGGEIGADSVLGVETPCTNGDCEPPPNGAVPEPFTMGLVGTGFLGLALFRRVRK